MKYTFGDIVIIDNNLIGEIVKSWITLQKGEMKDREKVNHEVYVREYNKIKEYPESKIKRYLVRHKKLNEKEKQYQYNAENNL